ncbi:MAG: tRNA (5-methylaminomethyl-2-thiouridine)(34)-methyltransferase MnmD [Chitinophagaceae bacterium]
MLRQPIITKDGSNTISIPEMNVTYHSHHGAIQESMHVFINAGLKYVSDTLQVSDTSIFEMGFGTGLNALLTLIEAEKVQRKIHYTTVELFPLQADEITLLNYCEQLHCKDLKPVFQQLHQCEWEKDFSITPFFTLRKIRIDFFTLSTYQPFHLIYYDAFAPSAQPQFWTKEVFEKLYNMLLPGGVLVTYCSKSDVRRAMQGAGFIVEKIQGPRGKREMVRARKPFPQFNS